MPPWLRTLASVYQKSVSSIPGDFVQMPQVVGDLVPDELGTWGLAIVRKVEEVNHARFLLQDRRPAKVHDALQSERLFRYNVSDRRRPKKEQLAVEAHLVILLTTVPDKHGIRLGKRRELKIYLPA